MRALDDHRDAAAGAAPRAAAPARFPTAVDPTEPWELQARCRGDEAPLFFGPNRFEPKRERLAREAAAKAICADCPAMTACRDFALSQGELYGVWGGLGELELQALQADRALPVRAAG